MPVVPPLFDIRPTTPPNNNVKIIICVCETSLTASTIYLSINLRNAVTGLKPLMKSAPENIPRINEIITCLKSRASTIASRGGRILKYAGITVK